MKNMNENMGLASFLPDTTPDTLDHNAVSFYRRNGFVRVRNLLSQDEAKYFRQAALEYSQGQARSDNAIFQQLVNVWREDEALKQLTLDSRIAAVAERLAGVPLRLWHDQILIKAPQKSKATEFHQDQPYWPHANSNHPISCWIALGDVPVERGCMSFIPRSHLRTDLGVQNLGDTRSLFSICPELEWQERVTVPLRAGDCTFHHGRCAHMATPNLTEEARIAHAVIFMDKSTSYAPRPHAVTDPLNLQPGQCLEGELFPSPADY